ncbi:MAG: 30S ribosomal protein S1 [Candidatus Harrisonbacteria bacterium CG10_big_fil_rev_8_21_14_0_10_49_15]|uniref:30S ribosomal protein S1 n=1 Tax=Candidatus Harrisonbacteria bacterium CG10_big_fil_rev_8_21_14_0_10_49_15 TaxID=1974587 RepID=A0A2H0UKE8_9BACT|nr:MAG: 30S ribosomal protein S1 [Candidatus Harrisonbacteria bacterium CG10_big_fil_rev_8_21_14_0_10_49_15]
MATTTKTKDSALAALLKAEASTIKSLKPNDYVDSVLIAKVKRAAYFDLGSFGTGIVFGAEYLNASDIIKKMPIGEKISAKVVEEENVDGYVEISLAEAGRAKQWEGIKEIKDQDDPISVHISGANSGGLLTEVEGMKAFLPVSQLSNEHYPRVSDGSKEKILEELKKLVGEVLKVKIISNTQNTNKLIVSEREVADESVKVRLENYSVGDVVDGTISGVADFGAFMRFTDQPSIEGLIHISELDHKLIEDPKEIVKVDEVIKAKIVEIKDGRVSLSLKALKPNPWDTILETFNEGQEVQGTVTRFNPFGAFVGLTPEIQGLIHVTEFGGVEEMKQRINLNQQYTFRIDSIKPAEKRIILKMLEKKED